MGFELDLCIILYYIINSKITHPPIIEVEGCFRHLINQ